MIFNAEKEKKEYNSEISNLGFQNATENAIELIMEKIEEIAIRLK